METQCAAGGNAVKHHRTVMAFSTTAWPRLLDATFLHCLLRPSWWDSNLFVYLLIRLPQPFCKWSGPTATLYKTTVTSAPLPLPLEKFGDSGGGDQHFLLILNKTHCWSSSPQLARTDSCLQQTTAFYFAPYNWLLQRMCLNITANHISWQMHSRSRYVILHQNPGCAVLSYSVSGSWREHTERCIKSQLAVPFQSVSRLTGCLSSCCLFMFSCKWRRREIYATAATCRIVRQFF